MLIIDLKEIFTDFIVAVSEKIPAVLTGILILAFCIVVGNTIYKILLKSVERKWGDKIVSNFTAQLARWSFIIVGLIIALNVIGFSGIAGGLIAGAGVSAIVFGFAFKDIGENFLAGIILALKRPFEIGDIIEVVGFKGSVKDLDVRMTHLRNVEGKDIYIPNSLILKNSLINYTKDGNLRVTFMVGIAPECDVDNVRSLIIECLRNNHLILDSPPPNVIVSELGEFTVDLQVLFWVDILANKKLPDSYLGHNIRSKAISDVKRLLDENQVEMPSQVIEHKMYRDNVLKVGDKRKDTNDN